MEAKKQTNKKVIFHIYHKKMTEISGHIVNRVHLFF